MSPTTQGFVVLVVTLAVLLSGIPVAFGLGAVSIIFLLIFQGFDSMHIVAETFYAGLDDFTLVSIPMFVMMGAAIGSSPAGKDLYEALDRWLYRLPGGLAISNIGACAIFAALTGSSPACCAAIGKMGIPEMRRRGYPDEVATGSICAGGTLGILIPPSITFILYGIATETSIGRLFIAGVLPGLMLTGLFILWTLFSIWRSGFRSHAPDFRFSWKQKFSSIPKIAPFIAIIVGVMYVLYGGIATPSEAAGVGAALCLVLAIAIYGLWRVDQLWLILRDTMRELVMILTIIAAAVLFGYMLTSLYLTQTLAQAIADLHANKWVLMFLINIFLLVCGFFIPPAAIILMTSPILLPIITAAGFDPVWFGVILTINMEIGLIHPPVGLNIYIVNAIAPDVPITKVMWGTLPYVLCMMLAIVILCIFPEIATWLPDHMMGAAAAGRPVIAAGHSSQSALADLAQNLRRVLAEPREGRSAAIGLPSIMIGVRTPGIVPPLAAALGRSIRMPRWTTCGSAKTWSSVVDRAGRHLHRFELCQQVGARDQRRVSAERRAISSAAVRSAGRHWSRIVRLARQIAGSPSTAHSLANWLSLPVAMMTCPSATGKTW